MQHRGGEQQLPVDVDLLERRQRNAECQHDGMDEVKLTVRLSVEDRRALKLHAVAQGSQHPGSGN